MLPNLMDSSQEHFKALANSAPIQLWICDADGTCTFANQSRLNFIGSSLEELDQTNWNENIHPDDREAFHARLRSALEDSQAFSFEYRIRQPNGSYRWVLDHIQPWFQEDGQLAGFRGFGVDLDGRKTNELDLQKRVQERTEQLEKAYKEMESFSYSVSHDLRAPLRSVNTNLAMLEEDFGDSLPNEAKVFMQRAREAGKRMDTLMSGILQLSRLSRKELTVSPVDVSELATKVCADLGGNCEVQSDLTAQADPDLLRVVLENLIGNAIKYRGSAIQVGRDEGAFFVRDNGVGFDMAHSDKLFKSFERLHSPAEFPGNGLGLASVKRIIERHGGKVWANGADGEGATFYFTLP